jgi:hypothetical protein
MIEERVERFRCNPEFYPYLIKVLERLPEDVLRPKILDSSWLEIVSFNPDTYGHCLRLPFPTNDLIILNEAILTRPEPEILHTIAHELGHMVAGSGKTGLWEKEAEDLVNAWGFEEESVAVTYEPAILENEGYQMGYLWAAKQKDLKEFKEFFGEWSRDALTCDRCNQLIQLVEARSVMKESRPPGLSPEELLLRLVFDDKDVFKTAAAYGVMSFLGKRSTQSEEDVPNSYAGTMEDTYCQCDWCGKDIKYGNASLSIDRMIQQADWDSEYDGVRLTVIDSQPLITLCARCAGKMNHHAIPEALATCRYDLRKKPDPPAHG